MKTSPPTLPPKKKQKRTRRWIYRSRKTPRPFAPLESWSLLQVSLQWCQNLRCLKPPGSQRWPWWWCNNASAGDGYLRSKTRTGFWWNGICFRGEWYDKVRPCLYKNTWHLKWRTWETKNTWSSTCVMNLWWLLARKRSVFFDQENDGLWKLGFWVTNSSYKSVVRCRKPMRGQRTAHSNKKNYGCIFAGGI